MIRMALIKCPECGKEISNKSDKCIHCGFPLRNEPIIQEYINGKYYDVSFLKNANLSYVKKIKKLNDLTGCGLVVSKEITKKYHVEQEQPQESRAESKDLIHCPKCDSTAITTGARGVNNFWGLLGASKTVNRCGNCGYTWKPNGR